MKIVLINPFPENAYGINEATIEPPLGLGYIATVLENDNCDVQIIDANVLGIHAPGVVDLTDKIKPDLIGVSTNIVTCVSSFNLITLLCRRLKKTQIIIGGPYPTSLPEYNLRTSDADAVVIGEGEQTVKEIVENMQKGKHPYEDVDGVAFKEDDHIIMNKTRRFIEDIDELGFPAYHLLPDMRRYKSRARQTPVASIITSRGCPYQCVYCNKGIFGNRVRMRSAENVMEEINYLVKEYKVRQIDILDDNFTADVKRAERIFDLLAKNGCNLAINIQNGVRADRLNQHLIKKMKKAGVFKLGFGVESGDEDILRLIKKNLALEQVIQATSWAKKEGIAVYGNFMIGLPGDTAQSMQKTIDFSIRMNPNVANFMITIPFPGTELYGWVSERGRFLIDTYAGVDAGFYGGQVFFEMGQTTSELVLKYYRKAYRRFYFRLAKIGDLLRSIKSCSELKWTLNAAFTNMRSIFK